METVTVRLSTSSIYRASEIVADLRNAAETLFYPLRSVGYWDGPSGDHLCPQSHVRRRCPHASAPGEGDGVPYAQTVEDELHGFLEVVFPHAGVSIFLG